jgi:hypothetical protein
MFTESLEHSLINPNQIRYDGHSLCDDPWDRRRSLGLVERDYNIFIPFQTRGTVIHFESRVPSVKELNTLPRLVLTEDTLWDPSTVTFRPTSSEDAARNSVIGNVRTSRVSSVISSNNLTPRESLLTSDSAISDVALVSVSPVFCDETLLPRLCAGVRVAAANRPNGTPVYMDERHSLVSPDNLARLWNIGLDAARHTLKTTTQIGVRHAVRPLSRRYQTDTQMLHYRQLDTTFYCDTMFSKVKSLKGNLCAQVFVADNFIRVHPMMTKSDAERALQVLAEDDGVPNHIVVDGAREQTGAHTASTRVGLCACLRCRNLVPHHSHRRRSHRLRENNRRDS